MPDTVSAGALPLSRKEAGNHRGQAIHEEQAVTRVTWCYTVLGYKHKAGHCLSFVNAE